MRSSSFVGRSGVVAVSLAAGVMIAGCSGSTPSATTPLVSTSTSVAPPSSGAAGADGASPTSALVSTPVTAAPIGSAQTLTATGSAGPVTLTVTVHGYAPFTPTNQSGEANAGEQTVAVDAEVCSSVANKVSAMDRWVLVDANNGRYEPDTLSSGPKPEYPYFPTDISADECIRGYIPFTVITAAPIATIRYSTEKGGYTLRWTV